MSSSPRSARRLIKPVWLSVAWRNANETAGLVFLVEPTAGRFGSGARTLDDDECVFGESEPWRENGTGLRSFLWLRGRFLIVSFLSVSGKCLNLLLHKTTLWHVSSGTIQLRKNESWFLGLITGLEFRKIGELRLMWTWNCVGPGCVSTKLQWT